MTYLVDLKGFICSMRCRWQGLGNISNPALEDAWTSVAQAFNGHIEGKRENWSVLQLPTGTGKTQGLAVYCAELAKLEKHCGVLIVTRFTNEADALCHLINELSGEEQAIARHSKIKTDDGEVRNAPVLIVTHKAYLDAVEDHSFLWDKFDIVSDDNQSWDEIATWREGKRRLTIIDETLNAVERVSVTFDEVRLLRGFITSKAEKEYAEPVSTLDKIIDILQENADKASEDRGIIHALDWREANGNADIKAIINAVNCGKLVNDFSAGIKLTNPDAIKRYLYSVVRRIDKITSSWCMYHNIGGVHTFSTANTSLPSRLSSAVILDATASRNYVYKLLSEVVSLEKLPQPIEKMRSYSNVNLNVIYKKGLGKYALGQEPPEHFIETLNSINPPLPKDKPFLYVVHVDTEERITNLVKEEYPLCELGHWGALDGKNDWNDLDTIVVHGIQYLGDVIADCSVMAYKKWCESAGIYSTPSQKGTGRFAGKNVYTPIDQVDTAEAGSYQQGHIEVSIIQAVNRIRCRKSIDGDGNCNPVTIHLFLPDKGKISQGVLDAFDELMPNINLVEQEWSGDAKNRKITKTGQKILDFLKDKPEGIYFISKIIEDTGIPPDTMENYIREYNARESAFALAMIEAGVAEYRGGKGRKCGFVISREAKKKSRI